MEQHKNGMAELMQSAGISLTINTDSDGLKLWNEGHGRHIQKGPDVLTFATSTKNLNFRTTFMPGSEVGRLHCIIAGELTTIEEMDFGPDDWSALSDKLTTRNTARIKGKSTTEKYIEKTLKAQRAASKKARLEYERSGDPQAVINFIKRSPSAAALYETWVNEVIQKWIRNDRHDLLKSAFLPRRGERSEARSRAIKGMMFVERIEKQRRAGKSLKEACIAEAERTGGGNLTGDDLERKRTALKGKYHRAKRIKTEITIQETAESFAMTAFPAKITQGDSAMFGEWKITFPKK